MGDADGSDYPGVDGGEQAEGKNAGSDGEEVPQKLEQTSNQVDILFDRVSVSGIVIPNVNEYLERYR